MSGREIRRRLLRADSRGGHNQGLIASAVVPIGVPIADSLIGLAITAVIPRIAWEPRRTVRGHDQSHWASTSETGGPISSGPIRPYLGPLGQEPSPRGLNGAGCAGCRMLACLMPEDW